MSLSYVYFAFSAFFNAVVSTFLGIFVLVRDSKSRVNRTLAWFCFAVAAWSYAYIGWPIAKTAFGTLLSFQLLHIPACFVSIFYLHFVLVWLGREKRHQIFIWFGYILSIFFASLTFSPYFIADMVPKFALRYWAVPGFLYHFYLLMFFGIFFYSSFLLFRQYFRETGTKKMQIRIMLIGMVLSFFGGSTNYFLWYDLNFPPYGNIFASTFVILSAYAIIRYKLLDIRLVATEGFILLMNLFLLFRFMISRDWQELLVNTIIFVASLIMSFLLTRSVKKEIRRREEISHLADSLEKANQRLQELDRQKTEFLSIASHQLRTPLSIMKGYIELIQDGAFGRVGRKVNKTLGEMDESNERLVKLVDEFLDITRIEQGRTKFSFVVSDLNKLITGVVAELKDRAASKGLSLVWKSGSRPRPWKMDEEKVRHVIFNYIDNAIKYSDQGKIRIKVEENKRGMEVRVIDQGVGFGSVDQAGFFQKFFRGANVSGSNVTGTGLGLYVGRKFIEAHGGQVWAMSPGLGKGGEFGFWLPRKPQKQENGLAA
ncbi:MAG TPA: ATP-binding protein [Patescibacteria group bacterium]|nr:ATP-binding protein [Patescibacteria group bacterium]